MGNYLSKLCCARKQYDGDLSDFTTIENQDQHLKVLQEEKLEQLFKHIISNAAVDYNNQEILDIENALYTMLERIRSRVNSRGMFGINRVMESGSMAAKTSIWKFCGQSFLEFDFLAVLDQSTKKFEYQTVGHHCRGCVKMITPPVDCSELGQYYRIEEEINIDNVAQTDIINYLFMKEVNYCLTSQCDCLFVHYEKVTCSKFPHISFRPSTVDFHSGCKSCTVDMPTGTLNVNTKISVKHESGGPDGCSLVFQWTSKTKCLTAPDLLLKKHQNVSSVPIFVDFLPAIGKIKSTPSDNTDDDNNYLIVPKSCNVCYDDDDHYDAADYMCRWRKSCCISEINTFTMEMSDKHKRCYQIMKYLSELRSEISGYHVKMIVLRHQETCLDTTDECVYCVLQMFSNLLLAFEDKELFSYKSNLNILSRYDNYDYAARDCKRIIKRIYSVSGLSTWETFIDRIKYMYFIIS